MSYDREYLARDIHEAAANIRQAIEEIRTCGHPGEVTDCTLQPHPDGDCVAGYVELDGWINVAVGLDIPNASSANVSAVQRWLLDVLTGPARTVH